MRPSQASFTATLAHYRQPEASLGEQTQTVSAFSPLPTGDSANAPLACMCRA
ncbi:MAG: hypothetical protein H6669_05415 [Ardenticatenaceae bacterium]|nr:hypothetical protein [Ardenticatenaceae bacterium]